VRERKDKKRDTLRASQEITANTLRKRFGDISRELEDESQAILIRQKAQRELVLLNA
jgi:hypothetical protein